MAPHLDIASLPVRNYYRDVRPTLRTGDLFFAIESRVADARRSTIQGHKGTAFLSPWSHVGLIFANAFAPSIPEANDRVLVFEAVEQGLQLVPLSKYLYVEPYDGMIVLARVTGIEPAAFRGPRPDGLVARHRKSA